MFLVVWTLASSLPRSLLTMVLSVGLFQGSAAEFCHSFYASVNLVAGCSLSFAADITWEIFLLLTILLLKIKTKTKLKKVIVRKSLWKFLLPCGRFMECLLGFVFFFFFYRGKAISTPSSDLSYWERHLDRQKVCSCFFWLLLSPILAGSLSGCLSSANKLTMLVCLPRFLFTEGSVRKMLFDKVPAKRDETFCP